MSKYKISILISTKNRSQELLLTLQKTKHLFSKNVRCIVFDDGSTDGTYQKVKLHFPEVDVLRNEISKGYIYCRNKMLNETDANFAISLDDDAHFLTENPPEIITGYFSNNPKCGLIATRIFWTKDFVENTITNENPQQVNGYVGCGHVWRMRAWHDIPNYPEWFQFYGEENFASLQLFKKNWEIHYVPQLFVQHRVDMKARVKSVSEVAYRYRRALRADWCNYFLFSPISKIPRKMAYSTWMQFKTKIFKGNFQFVKPLFLAVLDLVLFIPKLIKHRNALTSKEYKAFCQLNEVKIYWKPEK